MKSVFCLRASSFLFPPVLLCLLASVFGLLSPIASAQATRPAWAWDSEAPRTNEPGWVDPGPFQWAWQKEVAARLSPETGLPRTPGGGDAAAFEGLVRENVVLRREVERALRQLHESRQSQAVLEVQVRDLEQKRTALAASLREVRTADEVLAELARTRADRDALARDNDRLKQRVESMPTTPPPPPLTPALGSDLFKRIERENLELKVELASLKQTAREAEAARNQLEQFKKEQGTLADQSLKEKAELQAHLDQLQEGKGASDRQAQMAKKEAQALRERVAEIERELNMKKDPTPPTSGDGSSKPPASPEASLLAAAGGVTKASDELTGKAMQLAQRGKYREAEKLYLQALERTPDAASIHFNLGVLYQNGLRSSASAVKHFRKYLELNPQARDADQVRAWINELEMGLD